MLKYTGHPLVDVGVATITAFAGKHDPQQLTEADLDKIVGYIGRVYTTVPLRGFLHGAVFPNSGYTNPVIKGDRRKYFGPVLYAYRDQPPGNAEACVSCGAPSSQRIARDYFPLLTGRRVINFYPGGHAGLPVCGKCLLGVQAYPLGSGGLMLVVHSDNKELTLHFAQRFLTDNRRAVQLAQEAGDKKLLRAKFAHRTLLIDTLLDAEQMRRGSIEDETLFSITAYLISNSGQSPSLDIYHLPMQMVAFLRDMHLAAYHQDWQMIVQHAWEVAPKRKKKRAQPFEPRRNFLYEDLFELPKNAVSFLRTYLLRFALRSARGKTDPRGDYSLHKEAQLVSWNITERFLRRIMNMDPERVEQIRRMGDRLADYVSGQNDRRFFRDFFMVRRYDHFRDVLIKANVAYVKLGHPPIITLDPYIEVFEDGRELARTDWRLARDLVLIRMIERLYDQGWLGSNVDAIPETDETEAEES